MMNDRAEPWNFNMPNSPPASRRTVVTSAEFTRQFGHLRQSSGVDPVFITHHGRETHVLLTVNAYRALEQSGVNPIGDHGTSLPSITDLAGWIDQACIILDDHGRVLFANTVAHAMTMRDDGELVGRQLYDAIPELEGSLVQSYVNRAMVGREHCAADLPSLFRDEAWVRLEVFPTAHHSILLLKDITDDVRTNRLADFKQTLIDAVDRLGELGWLRLNVRGRIQRTDNWCAALLGLSKERLQGVALYDLVPRDRRVELRETIEPVLSGGASRQFDTALLANDGKAVGVRGAIAELHGAYGSEGAIIVLSRY